MSAAETETFCSDRLDEMIAGTIELSVPLRRGVIQIGAGGDADVGRIRVTKGPRTITVIRVDGRPMQVDIVTDAPESSRVFDAPVGELRLVRTADRGGRARWHTAGDQVVAERIPDVKRFADVIGTFAVAKQRRAQHSHRG
jgi:hypothetical protein